MVEKTNSNTSSDKKPDPKNFLFVSIDALITDIAWQVVKEGHKVRYYIASKRNLKNTPLNSNH